MFNGKIGIWSFTVDTVAQRGSVNRPKGALVLRNIESIDKKVYKHYIINKVIPAIKAAWPSGEKWKVIFIQQDNAKPHLAPTDPDVVAAGTSDGWNIRMLCQPPNSPDFNVLDLGFFTSIQSLQLRKGAHGINLLVEAVTAAYEQISVEALDNVFLSLQSVMLCALACKGGNEYKLPHSSKARLRREGKLPETLACDQDLYQWAVKEAQWPFN
ncbi:unnamed protein product [Phytophthora lilii]|uniref:Unnamed protein product n=1 Tax=Phytophthora lilii TaxID=2077276 RepID=A0A9W6YKD9_9STRA|nr:unnamed protein product [Phytophthora lilii]